MSELLAGPLLKLILSETQVCKSPNPFTRPNDLQKLSVETYSLTYCYVFCLVSQLWALSGVGGTVQLGDWDWDWESRW